VAGTEIKSKIELLDLISEAIVDYRIDAAYFVQFVDFVFVWVQ
jgi:hypothetical protein